MTESTPITNPTELGTTVGQFSSNTPVPLPLDFPEAIITSTSDSPAVPGSAPPKPHPILKHFEYDHLPLHLAAIAKEFHRLAHFLHDTLPMGAELIAGLRKLLEAKDCTVRAVIEGLEAL